MSTVILSGSEVAGKISVQIPEAVMESGKDFVIVKGEALLRVTEFLKNTPEFAFNYLVDLTAVDYYEYFEIVYQLTSMEHNSRLVLKTRCYDRNNPSVASVTGLFQGADFMEREIFDMMGIKFEGHPNLKRIFLWEGFQGYPLRKDYL